MPPGRCRRIEPWWSNASATNSVTGVWCCIPRTANGFTHRGPSPSGRACRNDTASIPARRPPTTASSSDSPTPRTNLPAPNCSPSTSRTSKIWSPRRWAALHCSPPDSASVPPAHCFSPRRNPGKRAPLWQQRQRSAQLLDVARKFPTFPILLETVRECLQDVYDLPALKELFGKIEKRQIRIVEVETASPSPFASALLFNYVGAFMYEGDSPLAERRAAALSLDSTLLAELLGPRRTARAPRRRSDRAGRT